MIHTSGGRITGFIGAAVSIIAGEGREALADPSNACIGQGADIVVITCGKGWSVESDAEPCIGLTYRLAAERVIGFIAVDDRARSNLARIGPFFKITVQGPIAEISVFQQLAISGGQAVADGFGSGHT